MHLNITFSGIIRFLNFCTKLKTILSKYIVYFRFRTQFWSRTQETIFLLKCESSHNAALFLSYMFFIYENSVYLAVPSTAREECLVNIT